MDAGVFSHLSVTLRNMIISLIIISSNWLFFPLKYGEVYQVFEVWRLYLLSVGKLRTTTVVVIDVYFPLDLKQTNN